MLYKKQWKVGDLVQLSASGKYNLSQFEPKFNGVGVILGLMDGSWSVYIQWLTNPSKSGMHEDYIELVK